MEKMMKKNGLEKLEGFLEILGLEEEPMALFYTDAPPETAFSPKSTELPTREKEKENRIDWQGVFGEFSCVMGHIWRARKKKGIACFSADRFGCAGGAFWLGFNKPQAETIIHYVSTGIPGMGEGERYCDSPDALRRMFERVDPRPAPKKYCVVKPIRLFEENEEPELVLFFSRPEILCGLHQLATFVTNDAEVVASPWSAACGGIAAWPLHYLQKGRLKAVIGGWDPSARQFFRGDELSFTVPFSMFTDMLNRYEESFLKQETWQTVLKKIDQSKKAWSKGQ